MRETYGVQEDGSWLPTPAEIRQGCCEIQERWTAREERQRRAWPVEQVELRECDLRAWGLPLECEIGP
jgi:hypothetical protein